MAGDRADGAMRSVFGSVNGDGAVVDAILEALAGPTASVSPTQFHNSVHNAAAGYWSIGTGSRRPRPASAATTPPSAPRCCRRRRSGSRAHARCCSASTTLPLPAPLDAVAADRRAPFAVALVLAPEPERAALGPPRPALSSPTAAPDRQGRRAAPGLRALARGNPAARALRLLEALARGDAEPDHMEAELLDGHVEVDVRRHARPRRASRR